MSRPNGLVLAGGRGRRLGREKGELEVAGARLAERAARLLEPLCREVAISIRGGSRNPAPAFPAIEDPPPEGRGPLAGIDAGFRAFPGTELLVLACDYPRVEESLLRELLARSRDGEGDVVLPVDGAGREHPLVGLWRAASAAPVQAALAAGRYRVGALLAQLRVRRLGGDDLPGVDLSRALLNVNRPSDLDELAR